MDRKPRPDALAALATWGAATAISRSSKSAKTAEELAKTAERLSDGSRASHAGERAAKIPGDAPRVTPGTTLRVNGSIIARADANGILERVPPLQLTRELRDPGEYVRRDRGFYDSVWMLDHRTGAEPPPVRTKRQAVLELLRAGVGASHPGGR